MKNKKTILIIIGAVIALLIIGAGVFYNNGIGAVSSKSEQIIVEVKEGASATHVLNTLDDAGLVKNTFCGKVFLKLNNFQPQKNTYVLNKNMSLSEIFSIMHKGDFGHILKSKLTIKEGTTIPEVAQEFAKILNVKKEVVIEQWRDKSYLKELAKKYWFIDEKTILNQELMYPLEGYLYPETYFVTDEKPTVQTVTQLALDMMDKKLTPFKNDISKLNWTPHQFLSFASVVERESLFDVDRPKIAGVFMNRLKQGKELQSDITVNYALQRTGVDVSIKMTQTDSKYNTYRYVGLPVGPISTIPERTLKDCINYSEHDYLYFFATHEGKVLYSKTYAEHMQTVSENKWY